MDTKNLLTTMVVALLIMLLVSFMFRGNGAAGPTKTAFSLYTNPPAAQAREGDAKEETITLGRLERGDKMAVTINTVTAGIDLVQLNPREYSENIKGNQPYTLFKATEGLAKPFATVGVTISGLSSDIYASRLIWLKAGDPTDTDAELFATFQVDPTHQLARVTKHFHVDPNSYELTISHTVENLKDEKQTVRIDQLGAPTLPRDDVQMDDRYFHGAGLSSAKNVLDSQRFNFTQLELPKIDNGTREIGTLSDFAKDPILWVSSSNRFFTVITRPLPETGNAADLTLNSGRTIAKPGHIGSANVDIIHSSEKPSDIQAVVRLTGAPMEIAPKGKVVEPITVYLGPKKRQLLDGNINAAVGSPDYARAVYDYKQVIQYSQGCWCYTMFTFDWVVQGFLWLLEVLKHYVAFGNYGVAIMILVIVVRLALHPLTRASQINMAVMGKKMKEVQPKLATIRKKYEGNRQKINEESMRIYRENDVNPAGGILGCLPILIQMPIWAALYSGLRTDIDLRHASFIPGWMNDLSNPDTVIPHDWSLGHPAFTLPFVGWDVYGLNILPILLTVVFFLQMKVMSATQPKPDPNDEQAKQQAQMQKMSQYMIFLFPLFLYNAPSGLNLYIFASTIGGLFDTYLVRKELKKRGILPATAAALPTHEPKD